MYTTLAPGTERMSCSFLKRRVRRETVSSTRGGILFPPNAFQRGSSHSLYETFPHSQGDDSICRKERLLTPPESMFPQTHSKTRACPSRSMSGPVRLQASSGRTGNWSIDQRTLASTSTCIFPARIPTASLTWQTSMWSSKRKVPSSDRSSFRRRRRAVTAIQQKSVSSQGSPASTSRTTW